MLKKNNLELEKNFLNFFFPLEIKVFYFFLEKIVLWEKCFEGKAFCGKKFDEKAFFGKSVFGEKRFFFGKSVFGKKAFLGEKRFWGKAFLE